MSQTLGIDEFEEQVNVLHGATIAAVSVAPSRRQPARHGVLLRIAPITHETHHDRANGVSHINIFFPLGTPWDIPPDIISRDIPWYIPWHTLWDIPWGIPWGIP